MKRTVLRDGDVREELTSREASQARPGIPVLLVLIVGLILACILLAIVFFGFKATDTVPNSNTKGAFLTETLDRAA